VQGEIGRNESPTSARRQSLCYTRITPSTKGNTRHCQCAFVSTQSIFDRPMSTPTEVKTDDGVKTTSFRFDGVVDRTAIAYLSLAVLYTYKSTPSAPNSEATQFTVKNLWFSPSEELSARKCTTVFNMPESDGPKDGECAEFQDHLTKQSESSVMLSGKPGFPVFLGVLEPAADGRKERFSLIHEYAGIPLSEWISETQVHIRSFRYSPLLVFLLLCPRIMPLCTHLTTTNRST